MDDKQLHRIRKRFPTYRSGKSTLISDGLEKFYRKVKEKCFGCDCSIFNDAIEYYRWKKINISREEALKIAKNKAGYKEDWLYKPRISPKDFIEFYSETDFYIFRGPYFHRFGGYRWMGRLVDHIPNPKILGYGCGSAVVTEYLLQKYPNYHFTVADIPSLTLDFVRWKKKKYNYPYEILEIGEGRGGIPLTGRYDLIICRDVLEHTPNPLEIVDKFIRHTSPGGVLCIDFFYAEKNSPGYGGDHLPIALSQREQVKKLLNEKTIVLKPIGDTDDYDGLYVLPDK